MSIDRLQLEPLRGIYGGRFWPVAESDLLVLEQRLGRPLPPDYVSFVTTYGTSRPQDEMIITVNDTTVGFESFYADPPNSDVTSVVKLAEQYPELPQVTIASAESGLFHMIVDGSIVFEQSGDRSQTPVAASFAQFVNLLQPDPTLA